MKKPYCPECVKRIQTLEKELVPVRAAARARQRYLVKLRARDAQDAAEREALLFSSCEV